MKIRHSGEVAIIDVVGTVRFGPESNQFHDGIIDIFEKGSTKILLNLAGLERFDSSGLGSLVSAYASITRRDGAVKLLSPGPRVAAKISTPSSGTPALRNAASTTGRSVRR